MGKTTVLVTGGAGFAGAHICEHILHTTGWDVIVLDRISYAGSLERLADIRRDFPNRLFVVHHDFRAEYPPSVISKLKNVSHIIHNGAETHVQRSLDSPIEFVHSNVQGTMHTLELARKLKVQRFIYVSTDEVHGPAPECVDFTEEAAIRPSNPYSASKAGGEALAYAWWRCYEVPVVITRTMNLFGERQHPEKFLPKTIRNILSGGTVIVHGKRLVDSSVPPLFSAVEADGSLWALGSRKWLHARNQADALVHLMVWPADICGQTFHIAGVEKSNFQIAEKVANILGKPLDFRLVDWHKSRPGHDLRYSLDDTKIRSHLGWQPPLGFEESFTRSVLWMSKSENLRWLEEA